VRSAVSRPLEANSCEVAISLLWHASYDRDPAHMWLRQLLIELVEELCAVSGQS